jgi:hypothetical protein
MRCLPCFLCCWPAAPPKHQVSPATAHIVLGGAGASGVFDDATQSVFNWGARQFGDVRVWTGFPWARFFDATQLVVTGQTDR